MPETLYTMTDVMEDLIMNLASMALQDIMYPGLIEVVTNKPPVLDEAVFAQAIAQMVKHGYTVSEVDGPHGKQLLIEGNMEELQSYESPSMFVAIGITDEMVRLAKLAVQQAAHSSPNIILRYAKIPNALLGQPQEMYNEVADDLFREHGLRVKVLFEEGTLAIVSNFIQVEYTDSCIIQYDQ